MFTNSRACDNKGNAYLSCTLTVNIVPHHSSENILVKTSHPSKEILLGEDDIDDEELLKELFSSVDNSFSLTFINNGKQVIDYLNTLPDNSLPCLIVLDYNMPALNGADVLQELKNHSRYSSIPKIVWSTSQSEIYKKKCLELEATDYIIKPSRVNELLETIQYMLSFC
jgi:CheY-like chemotaxis protein